MKNIRFIIVVLILCLSFLSFQLSSLSIAEQDEVDLTFVTGASGGAHWTLGASFSEIVLREAPWINISVKPGASIPNIVNVQNKSADIGVTYTVFAPMAIKGEGDFTNKATDVRAIASLDPNFFIQVLRSDIPVKSWKDIKENQYPLRLATSRMGSLSYTMLEPIINQYGINIDDFQKWGGGIQITSEHSESVSLLKDRHADGWVMIGTYGHPSLTDLLTTQKMNFISLEPDIIEKLEKNYGYLAYTLPANSFLQQPNDVITIGILPELIVHQDMNEDVVYNITKILCEYFEDLTISAVAKEYMDPKTWWKGTVFPLHKGAERYYKEQGLM